MAVVFFLENGEVLDCKVLSKHCDGCVHWDGYYKSSHDYIEWYDGHKDHCN